MRVESAPEGQPSPPEQIRSSGAVYTPPSLAEWVAERLLRSLPDEARTVLDPAVGSGRLLEAVARQSPRRLALVGVDVDAEALTRSRRALPDARLLRADTIAAAMGDEPLAGEDLDGRAPDGIILNPPWGIELSLPRKLLARRFSLARGQYDSADLFVEVAVGLLAEGGAAALILPDSLFFPERAPLRRFLLESCRLELVARLGEGFFPGVYRGTAVVVLRKGLPAADHTVECLRLTPPQRRAILAGQARLAAVAAESSHPVPQRRFAASESADLSIDVRDEDLRRIRVVDRVQPSWADKLVGGRGVELSKHGEIVECRDCGRSRPKPRRSGAVRCSCGVELPQGAAVRRIVAPIEAEATGGSWAPLIAGEDVKRYHCAPSRRIETGVAGINYKDSAEAGERRLLFRKTGIGLKASLFAGDALTTQTVFHFRAGPEAMDFLLPYALGVAASRLMLAIHLKRSGENEWRSHPYVTQAMLAQLPIPEPKPGTQAWKQAAKIAEIVAALEGRVPSAAEEIRIEGLVAGLYGLGTSDIDWVAGVLAGAQGLEGIASLRIPPEWKIVPHTVD